MILIEVHPQFQQDVDPDVLELAVRAVMVQMQTPSHQDVAVQITTTERLHELNYSFRAVDAPTDVLAFPDGDVDIDTGEVYLGSVEIAYPVAKKQADAGGHSVMEELQLLVVHGVLHLHGQDHYTEDEKADMWAAQEAILTKLGVSARPADD